MTGIIRYQSVAEELATRGITITPAEERMLRARDGERMRDMGSVRIAAELSDMLKWISLDLGIQRKRDRIEEEYITVRLAQVLITHYQNVTTGEIKMAFELLMVGELDQYLPKNRNGEAERAHYQEFSLEFFTRIMNAYQQRQRAMMGKIRALLPEATQEKTPEEKRQLREGFVNLVKSWVEKIKKGEALRDYEYSRYFYECIIKANGIEEDKPTPGDYQRAKMKIDADLTISNYIRNEIDEAYKRQEATPRLHVLAESIMHERRIKEIITNNPEAGEKTIQYIRDEHPNN